MSNKCGECLLFEGSSKKCGGGRMVTSNFSACSTSFKGPASLFGSKKVCGGCRLFKGSKEKCGAGRMVTSNLSACNNNYAPTAG